MTFLHKLARRLAAAVVVFIPVLVLGCSQGEERDFLSPNPAAPSVIASITISPKVGTIRPGETIQFTATGRSNTGKTIPADVLWNATGGTIAQDGLFTADHNGEFHIAAVARTNPDVGDSARVAVYTSPTDIILLMVSPDSLELATGEGVQFQAIAKRGDGSEIQNPGLAWSTTGGNVDGGGWYVASDEGTFSVNAKASGGVEGSSRVIVRKSKVELEQISITPGVVTIATGDSVQFAITGHWSNGTSGSVSPITWQSTGGTISGGGLFSSGSTPGNYRVIAKYKKGILADTAFISLTEPTVVGVRINPGQVVLAPSATQQYSARAEMSDGSEREVGVTWQVSAGQVTSSGLFTAPAVDGSYQVIAGVSGTSLSDTSAVTVSSPAATQTTLVLNPSSANVPAGTTRQFSVTSLYSDGTTRVPAVTWQATGVSITAAGLFTAAAAQGTYQVIALDVSSGMSDTSAVVITAPTLSRLTLDPPFVDLQPGMSLGFSVSGEWSDGSAAAPTVGWSVAGGTMTAGGVYTAGNTEGTFTVVAAHPASGLADTSYVTVASPPLALNSLTISPTSVILAPGEVQRFRPAVQWSDGSTTVPALTWSATGGVVSGDGVFTAGSAEGFYPVEVAHEGGLSATAQVRVSAAAPSLSAIEVLPGEVTLQVNGARQFTVQGVLSDGSSTTPSVTWSASGGTVTNGGLYVAPSVAGTQHVIATALGTGITDTAIVVVTTPVSLVGLLVSPDSAEVQGGATLQFSATGIYSNGGTGTPTVSWSATGGSISLSGLYTAGALAGTFRVIATSGSVADTVEIDVNGAQLTGFYLTPDSVTLNVGGSRQFSAAATWSDGQVHPVSVTYTATGGSITLGGLYTGGNTVGKFLVVASCACGAADSAQVELVSGPPPSLTTLTVTPESATTTVGQSIQFLASGTWSDGSAGSAPVTWSASGGVIDSTGNYSPDAAGTYLVVAQAQGGALADTSVVIAPSPPQGAGVPELPRVYLDTHYVPPTGKSIRVNAGGNLQAALDAAVPGDEVVLEAGATFTGSYWLRRKSGTGWITIRSDTPLPPEGTRVGPQDAVTFAKIVATSGGSAAPIRAENGASNYRLMGLEITAASSVTDITILVRIHPDGGTSSVADLPWNIIVDRSYVHGHSQLNVTTCIRLNSGAAAVIDSYLSECHAKGRDAQAIGSNWGSGPFKIVNNYLEGSGENVMFGGSDNSVLVNVVPSDIEIRGNHFYKPPSWRGVWTVKNLFESKSSQRVLIEGNVFENNWVDAQAGAAILLKSVSQSGNAPWSVTRDITIRNNVIRNSPQGVNIASAPANVAIPAHLIRFENNLFDEVGSGGSIIQLLGSGGEALAGIQFVNNTMISSSGVGKLMAFSGTKNVDLEYRNNVAVLGNYGVKGDGVAIGTPSLDAYWASYLFNGNGLVGSASASAYPAGNTFVSSLQAAGVLPDGSLASNSPLKGKATGGGDPGAAISAIRQATATAVP